jgi:hypothetical protein
MAAKDALAEYSAAVSKWFASFASTMKASLTYTGVYITASMATAAPSRAINRSSSRRMVHARCPLFVAHAKRLCFRSTVLLYI